MLNIKKLSKEEMKLIRGCATTLPPKGGTPPAGGGGTPPSGGTSNGGNMTCGEEPDPITEPQAHEYWKNCTESGGSPTICPAGFL